MLRASHQTCPTAGGQARPAWSTLLSCSFPTGADEEGEETAPTVSRGDVCWEREGRAWHEAGCGASGVVASQPSPFRSKCENFITNARFLKQESQIRTRLSLCSHSLSLTAPQIFTLPSNFPADWEGGPGSRTRALPEGTPLNREAL